MEKSLHYLAIIFGIVAAFLGVITVALAFGFTTSAAVDNITQLQGEFYTALAIVAAVACEWGSREA